MTTDKDYMRPADVSCRYGAPMGRYSRLPADPSERVKLRLVRLRFVGHDYDEGGAYWGGGDPIYFAKGEASDVVVEVYVRAKDRLDAKRKVREKLPNAVFYR